MIVQRKEFLEKTGIEYGCLTCEFEHKNPCSFPCSHCSSKGQVPGFEFVEWEPKRLVIKEYKRLSNIPSKTRLVIILP